MNIFLQMRYPLFLQKQLETGEAARVGKSPDAAELLVLAERYSALFSLTNRELAGRSVATTEEEFNKRQ